MKILIILSAILFSILRLTGWKSEAFQAFAHLYVGYLFCFWQVGRDNLYFWLFVAVCLVELFSFFVGTF